MLSVLYVIVAVVSYLSLGDLSHKTDLFILRKNLGSDLIMKIARGFLLIGVLIGGCLNLYPIKEIVLNNFKLSITKNLVVSLIIMAVTVLMAKSTSNITKFVTIGGIFGGTITVYTFPGLLGFYNQYYRNKFMNMLLLIWTLSMTVFGMIGTYFSIRSFN